MRSQLFVNYLPPMLPLGEAICKTVATPAEDPPWQPHPSMPGYKIRHFRNGRMEIEAPEDTPATVVTRKEPPYCPPDWGGFQYHGADGKADEVVRPAPATCTALASQAASAVETTEHGAGAVHPDDWQSGAPAVAGWYSVQDDYDRAHRVDGLARYFDGKLWSEFVRIDASKYEKLARASESSCISSTIGRNIRYRGPRLAGKEWPEPEAKAEEVPSVGAVERAYIAAHSRNWRAALSALQAMHWAGDELSPAECAAAIAAFDAIPAA